ncbi:potassium channel family protein [Arthrobacter agilis]|uniref:potassium channel family protein n=1 Tax=Arthrobacter agilis TaxID=37921 RepID=UPI0027864CFC|nr:potassium channel family protein [Arthrobacter agilis]MDQ0734480.1 voltage-gated potassium channel [Arthrobacter agilis]
MQRGIEALPWLMIRRQDLRRPALFLHIDRGTQRRLLVAAVARTASAVGLTLLVYAVMPIDGFTRDDPAAAWFWLVVVGAVFLTAMTFQVRLVARADAPQIRAVEAVVHSVVLFLCLFSMLYTAMSATDPASFSEPLSKVDGLYFTSTTLSTVGFGDITPASDLARAVVTVQLIAGLGVLALIAEVFFFAARQPRGEA